MSELRKDPILNRWVIIAAERGRRPKDFASATEQATSSSCPFCGGNEHMTPPEISAIGPVGREPDTADWDVRVVSNKFPALSMDGDISRKGVGLFDRMAGVGAHEVIIETPDHDADFAALPQEHLVKVINAEIMRINELRKDDRFRHIVVFRNYGSAAGASLSHPHSQLIALPIVPQLVHDKLIAARMHYRRKERCIFCDLIEQELALPERIVMQNEHFVVLSAFAARFPFEVNIFPLRHQHDFVNMSEREKWALADVFQRLLSAYRDMLGNPAYNMMLQTSPSKTPRPGHPDYWGTIEYDYHWHIELMPRLTKVAGFEWGTGFYINPVSPESAAEFLRAQINGENEQSEA